MPDINKTDLMERLHNAILLGERTGSRGMSPSNIYNLADEALSALETQATEIAELRAALERIAAHTNMFARAALQDGETGR